MGAPRGDSEQTKAEILAAARLLFAEYGILAVSVRDIAKQAGVTHGLVHHYFGTKDQLVQEVIAGAITSGADVLAGNPIDATPDSLEVMRRVARHFLTEGKTTALLLTRAELTGFAPEKMRPAGVVSSIEIMAKRFAELRGETGPGGPGFDPALLSVFVAAAMFGLITMHPWLMTAAGLEPEDYERRLDEIIEIAVSFIAQSVGIPGAEPR
jgi:AcrR family transcriptional regulator